MFDRFVRDARWVALEANSVAAGLASKRRGRASARLARVGNSDAAYALRDVGLDPQELRDGSAARLRARARHPSASTRAASTSGQLPQQEAELGHLRQARPRARAREAKRRGDRQDRPRAHPPRPPAPPSRAPSPGSWPPRASTAPSSDRAGLWQAKAVRREAADNHSRPAHHEPWAGVEGLSPAELLGQPLAREVALVDRVPRAVVDNALLPLDHLMIRPHRRVDDDELTRHPPRLREELLAPSSSRCP